MDRRYRPKAARSDVAACAALSLTHPTQVGVIEAGGIVLARRRWIMQPARVAAQGLAAWVRINLEMAAELARPDPQRAM